MLYLVYEMVSMVFRAIATVVCGLIVVVMKIATLLCVVAGEWIDLDDNPLFRALLIGGIVAVLCLLFNPLLLFLCILGAVIGLLADPEKEWKFDLGEEPEFPIQL